MINLFEVAETNKMIEQENLDVRTITLGISLLDCMLKHWINVLMKLELISSVVIQQLFPKE